MFRILRARRKSEKARSNCIRLTLEALEARDAPAAHNVAPGLAHSLANAAAIAAPAQGSMNGAAGQMPAFYDGQSVTVNMKEQPDHASDATIEHNRSINTIYATNDLDDPQDFVPVIDAIQGDGFNPLWQQVLIVFNDGSTPHQFTSEEDILAAASGPNPEITLVVTGEVYRCSVVGQG